MASDPGFELKPSSSPLPAAEREKLMKDLGFGRLFTEHMVTIRYRAPDGWGTGLALALRADLARPGGVRAPLRASDFRRLQGLSPAGRRHRHVSAGSQRAALQSLRRALGHAGAAGRALRRSGGFADSSGSRLGAAERGRKPVPAPADDRDRGGARRAPGQGVLVLAVWLARRAPTSRRASSRSRFGCARNTCARRRAARAKRSARATMPRAWSRSSRRSTRAASRWSGSTPCTSASSKRWAA